MSPYRIFLNFFLKQVYVITVVTVCFYRLGSRPRLRGQRLTTELRHRRLLQTDLLAVDLTNLQYTCWPLATSNILFFIHSSLLLFISVKYAGSREWQSKTSIAKVTSPSLQVCQRWLLPMNYAFEIKSITLNEVNPKTTIIKLFMSLTMRRGGNMRFRPG